MKRSLIIGTVLLAILLPSSETRAQVSQPAQQSTSSSALVGDAKKGKALFDQTYRCYACHGFTGETGSPRLVPMSRSQDAFIAYLRKPSTQAMPKFADVPTQDIADVYAYIRSIRPASPPVENIPLLNEILRQVTEKK